MSRIVRRMITVETDRAGKPTAFTLPNSHLPRQEVRQHLTYWREWIGVLEGEPERDVWWVETQAGICEIHRLCQPAASPQAEVWLLHAWQD